MEDFQRLYEQLKGCPDLPVVPSKTFFGGNDPKVIEDRRVKLEVFMKFIVTGRDQLVVREEVQEFLELPEPSKLCLRLFFLKDVEQSIKRLRELVKTT